VTQLTSPEENRKRYVSSFKFLMKGMEIAIKTQCDNKNSMIE
jgi:hypothetical protein